MREALAYFPMQSLPLIGLCIFVGSFIGIAIWVFRRESGEVYARMGKLPLDLSESEKGDRNV